MYNDLTVCVNNIKTRNIAVLAALKTAQRYGGSVCAIYIKLDTAQIVSWQGTPPMEIAHQLSVDQNQREDVAKAEFERLASDYECEVSWRTLLDSDQPIKGMLCTDIIFTEQPQTEEFDYHRHRSFLNHLILESKRPVLMIPKDWQQDLFGAKVLLGWDAGPEAMRAVSDALPILQSSENVIVAQVLTKRMAKRESDSTCQIQKYLNNKKIINQVFIDNCDTANAIPETLIKRAADEAVDLIVVGGYGHSRLREMIMGGMTDQLITESTIPVFFSH